jgi:hypothetical protein
LRRRQIPAMRAPSACIIPASTPAALAGRQLIDGFAQRLNLLVSKIVDDLEPPAFEEGPINRVPAERIL